MTILRTLAAAAALLLSGTGGRPAPGRPPVPMTGHIRFADGSLDCPVSHYALYGHVNWCERDCTMNVRFPGAASPLVIPCDVHATTRGSAISIEIGVSRGRHVVGFTVALSRDGAALAGAGFSGDEVSAGAIQVGTGHGYSRVCGDGRRGEATVTIGPAVVKEEDSDPVPTRWWAVHGSASARLIECVATDGQVGGTAEVTVSF